MIATRTKSETRKIAGACALALASLVTSRQTLAATPYTGWTQPYNNANSPNSPYLFNFDESSGTTATNSGDTVTWGTTNGTYSTSASSNIVSGAGVPPSPAFGNAAVFTGSNSISVPGTSSILGPFNTGFVLETWFRSDSLPANNTSQAMVTDYYTTQGHPGARHYALSLLTLSGSTKLYFNPWRSDGVNVELFSTTAITTGVWHHAAAQYRTTGTPGWELYLDGNLEQSIPAAAWGWTEPADFSPPAASPNDIILGAYPGGVAPFIGALDDVRISEVPGFNFAPAPPGWVIDGSGDWNQSSNWVGGVPNAVGASATFGGAITAAHTVYTDIPVTVGEAHFNNLNTYVIAGAGTLTLQTSSGNAVIDVQQGTQKINVPLIVASDTTLSVTGGAILKISDPVTVNDGKSLASSGAGTVVYESTVTLGVNSSVTFASSQHVAGLTVGQNSRAMLAAGGGSNRVLEADSLSINPSGGKLDLQDNKMIRRGQGPGTWNGSSYTGTAGQIASGRGNGTWNGSTGIVTSQTTATVGGNYTSIGVALASDIRPSTASATALWAGQTISGGDTLVMYTYGGDANLDGKLNVDDYIKIDSGIAAGLTGWSNGDFNYDGKINIDDYTTVIDANIGNQSGVFPTGSSIASDGLSAVPEPASIAVIGLAAAGVLLRRRRNEN